MSRNTLCIEHQRIINSLPPREDPPLWHHVLCDELEQAMTVAHWRLTRDAPLERAAQMQVAA